MSDEHERALEFLTISWEWKTFDTLHALGSFRKYCDENERLIRTAAEEAERTHGPRWHPVEDGEHAEHYEEKRIARHLYDEIVTPVFRHSCVTMLYAVVERELRRLAENLIVDRGPAKLSYKDLRGGTLEQITKWCNICYGLEVASFKEFRDIRDLQKVRNCIVHLNGEIDDSRDKKEILAMTGRYPGFHAWEHADVAIEPEFVLHMHRQVWTFFLSIFAELRWKVDVEWNGK